jgi:RNA polymerase sigma-70 factor (ECF subfamily)
LTSEVFHRALTNLHRFEWRGAPFASWLFRIAANAIADKAQRGGKELAVDEPPEMAEDATVLADLEGVERRARLFRLVEQLPEDQRRVIAIREIAEALGRTEGAVKQLQFRALQGLRAKIKGGEPQRARSVTKGKKKSVGKDA